MIASALVVLAAVTRTPVRLEPSPTSTVAGAVLISRSSPDPKEVSARCRGATHSGPPVIEAHLQTDGRVRDVRVVQTCGCAAGDQLLVDSIRTWKYRPAMANGKPIEASVTVSVTHFLW